MCRVVWSKAVAAIWVRVGRWVSGQVFGEVGVLVLVAVVKL